MCCRVLPCLSNTSSTRWRSLMVSLVPHAIEQTLTPDVLQRIWDMHHLGEIKTLVRPKRGIANYCLIVNETHVIRFDFLEEDDHRYRKEAWAYNHLRGSIPVPEVVTLDMSRTLAPYDYLIASRVTGAAVIDSWFDLPPQQQEHVAYTAGVHLAVMHNHPMNGFGSLHTLDFTRWSDYVVDLCSRYSDEALACGATSPETIHRIRAALNLCRPLLDAISSGAVVHSDYHFENILQHEGEITGVIDFEWAISGDPSWDFRNEDQWDDTCPGSKAVMYAGYQSLRPLDAAHPVRTALYKVLLFLDDVVLWEGTPHHANSHARLLAYIDDLERLL